MAEETGQETGQTTAPKKKNRLVMILVVLLIVVLLGGGGTAGFLYWRTRNALKAAAGKTQEKKSDEPNESDVTQVVELQPFVVNLADREEPRYLRMTISLGLSEAGSEKPDPLFTTKVRNAILAIVTQKTAEQILTVEGKAALRKEMLSGARSVVNKPSVQAIYITDFIVQL